jgi:hypothetical protein
LLKAKARQAALRIAVAQRECQQAERARDAAQKAVTAAYIELGRAILASEVSNALRSAAGRK